MTAGRRVMPIGRDFALVSRGSRPFAWAYQSRFEATISVKLMLHDITVGLYHHVDFGLDARELSTFGEATDYASLLIVAGPVADVTVTTPHTEALRLIGHNRRDEITPEMDVDVVIAEFCANPPTKDPSEDGKLRAAEGETSTLEWETLNRDNWLAANAAPPSH